MDTACVAALRYYLEHVGRSLKPDRVVGLRVVGELFFGVDAGDVVRAQHHGFELTRAVSAHQLRNVQVELRERTAGVAHHAGLGVDGLEAIVTFGAGAALCAHRAADASAEVALLHLLIGAGREVPDGAVRLYVRLEIKHVFQTGDNGCAQNYGVVHAALVLALLRGGAEVELWMRAARVADHARPGVHGHQRPVAERRRAELLADSLVDAAAVVAL